MRVGRLAKAKADQGEEFEESQYKIRKEAAAKEEKADTHKAVLAKYKFLLEKEKDKT